MSNFILTNMNLKPWGIIRFYCNRGKMENFIKESKSGFESGYRSPQNRTPFQIPQHVEEAKSKIIVSYINTSN
ncbi:MAG: Transposase domain group 1 [Anaerocolumna sp.]|jgi:hypothetical protein|nr:Transposase domain group 1 [Anaerocolumna sp.]